MSDRNYWTTLRQRKISRRTMLGASAKAGVGVAGLALVGCGDDDEPDAGAVAAERAAAAAEEAAAAAVAAGEARAADSEAAAAVAASAAAAAADAADAAADAADAAGEASAAASQAASAADAAAALAAEAAESEDAGNAAAAAEAAAAAAAQAADAAGAAGDAAAAAVADAAAQAAEAAAQAARDVAAAVEAGTATAAAAQAAIDAAAEAAAAAGQAAAAAGAAAATAQQTAEAAAETAAAAVAAAEDAAQAAREAADAAAAGDEEPEEQAAVGEVDLDAELTIGYGSFPPTLDVHTAAGQGGNSASNRTHFRGLFAERDIFVHLPEGGFASYEFADNNSQFVIELQPGITFHNGEPLDAEHLAWYYERSLGRAEYNPDFQSANDARGAWMGDITIVDDLTVSVGMDPPFVNAPQASGGAEWAPVPKFYIVENGDDHFATNPVGTGPNQFVSWIPDQEIRSTRFEDFFFPRDYEFAFRAGWVKDLVARLFPEEQSRAAALEAGEIDIAHRINTDTAVQFEDDDDFKVIVLPDVRVMAIELPINQSDDPITGGPNPWRDKRVRQAANYALDTASIVENLLTGNEEPRAYSPFPAGYPLPLGDLEAPYNYDPDRARALLEEAGQVGFAFTITLPTGLWTGDTVWMPAIQQMLNDVGFQVEVDYADFGNALAQMRNHELFNPFIFNQAGTTAGAPLTPAFSYNLITAIGKPYSHANATDDFLPEFEEFQALIDEAGQEFDAARRDDLYFQAAEIHYSNAFHVPLFNLSHLYAARSNIVYNQFFANTHTLFEEYIQVLKT